MVHDHPDPNQTEYDFAGKYEQRGRIATRLIDGFFGSAGELMSQAAPSTVLEVGCGEGFSTVRLQEALFDHGHEVRERVAPELAHDLAIGALPSARGARLAPRTLSVGPVENVERALVHLCAE